MQSAAANGSGYKKDRTPAQGTQVKIGRFKILKVLGKGAQGVVYLAQDPNLGREVAIKTLDAYRNISLEKRERLIKEAKTVSKLKHPNVAPLYEAGSHGDRPYLVFEHIEGRPLKEILAQEKPLKVSRAVKLMIKILAGIGSAHKAGIIHKDLSPNNIMVEEDDTPRIMDFGISIMMTDAKSQSGQMAGTVNYMSPEHGVEGPLTPQADIFSLGVILFEMLTGRTAFSGENAYAVLYQIAYETPPKPSSINSNVDDKLDRIVLKALEKALENRYSSADDMKAELEAWLKSDEDGHGMGGNPESNSAVEFILKRMRYKKDFPTFSSNVIEINKKASMAGSNMASAADLSRVILKDFSLTNKLLRLVNSAFYGQFAGKITTVSRAVVVLGFEEVRMAAASLMLFDHIQNKSQREDLKDASVKAFMSGMIAKEIGDSMQMKGVEEALVCAMLHNLGRHLAAFYLPDEYDEIKKRMIQKDLSEKHASKSILGVSFEELGMAVAKNWKFPDKIVQTLRTLPPGNVDRPKTPEEMLRNLANLSNEVCEAVSNSKGNDRKKVLDSIARRYQKSVPLSTKKIEGLLHGAKDMIGKYANILDIDVQKSPFIKAIEDEGIATVVPAAEAVPGALPGAPLPGAPLQESSLSETQEQVSVLITGIQEITNAMLEEYKLNDMLFMVLETMYRGFGFQRVLFAVMNNTKTTMTARFGFGLDMDNLLKKFSFDVGAPNNPRDVFQLCVAQKKDIRIDDIKILHEKGKLPKWYIDAVLAPAFALYPVVVNNQCIGMFYMDREQPGVVIGGEHHNYIKTLRNQAVMAIRHAR
ncbi:serine/threonine protein kinase [Desulfatibacillum aliphaticivorans]|uniref:Serine/threonine protein kinase n=1 Tax=Desulfatibacillum aliphaticivorans TaxID=218208 RepID=B8FLU5_DESAL|nr:serine/threonine protein kinase [Desulfatibacillum aliphaticivorans]ACL05449.1 serine/threonine protein kinase [Desulfatibacillum aliphaticivorans]